jgi:hypothetical protein
VRIIGGSWRGRRVHFPDSPGLRPTPDRCARPCSIGCSIRSPARAASTCSPVQGRSGSKRCRAARREVVFVEQAFAAAQMLAEELKRFHGARRAARAGAWWKWAPGVFSPRRRRSLRPGMVPRNPSISYFSTRRSGSTPAGICPLIDAGGGSQAGGWIYLENARSPVPPAICRLIGSCSNRSPRARWGIIWRASNVEIQE